MNIRRFGYFEKVVATIVLAGVGCGGDDSSAKGKPSDGGGADTNPGWMSDGGSGSEAGLDGGGLDVSSGDDASGEDAAESSTPVVVLPGPSHGSSVALSPDDSVAVVTNRDVGSVTVLKMSYPTGAPATAAVIGEVNVGMGSEPWQAVISPDNTIAYVALRHDQKVAEITGLQSAPALGRTVAVGSEPAGIALTPTGAKAWVANWVDGTLMGIDTASMTVASTVDLNAPLVAFGSLGTVTPRPALAHPRSVATTNNGDTSDADESIYVTEYFAQVVTPEASDGSNADTHKSGVVYRVRISDKNVSTISLAPLADMGFKDERSATAGCYPNQLQSITLNGGFAYVTSICASPKGPTGPKVTTTACATVADCSALNLVDPACAQPTSTATGSVCVDLASVKTTTAPLVSVIDTTSNTEVTASTASLNAKFRDFYVTKAVPDSAQRRYPLFANDMSFVPGSGVGYVSANGADAVFRVRYDATGAIAEVGASTANFIDLNPTGIPPASAGQNPTGVAVSNTGKGIMLVASEVTRVLTVVDLKTQAIAGGVAAPSVVATTALPPAGSAGDAVLKGKHFFNTGLGRWSLRGQAWGACQSCHSDALTDNVTWYFARGPRQSTSLDATFSKKDPTDQRVLNWTGINDELADFELNTRGISGGVGAIVSALSMPPATADRIDIQSAAASNAGLNGSSAKAADPLNPLGLAAASKLANWSNITSYVQTIRSPRAATGLDATKVAAGQALFSGDGACQGCHGGAKWTISKVFYDPTPATSAALKSKAWPALNGFPTALLPATQPADQVMRFGGANPAAFDQLLCMMRPVGTFDVAEPGAGIAELRVDMTTAAQGGGDASGEGKGYNPPSLLGMVTGGPYYHGGNARTLEAAFSSTFATHHQSLAPNFLTDSDPAARAAKVDQLVAFLLSVDGDTTTVGIPALGAQGGDFCQAP
jgi:mono/diheme cytochrome c family protein